MTISLDQSAFMVTFTGKRFHLFNPIPNDILIVDIAHALSQICRFTGHTRKFLSVAEHCVMASERVPSPFAREALLHDAAEAYVNDLSRPLKHAATMCGYVEVEKVIDRAIRAKFGLPTTMSPAVKAVDNMLVCTEARQLLADADWAEGHPYFENLAVACWSPESAERAFLSRFAWLEAQAPRAADVLSSERSR